MTKKLKVLEDLAFIKEKFAYLEYNSETFNVPKKELCNVKQALQRLEAIDNTNPNEAIEWFGEQWVEYGIQDTVMQIKDTKEFTTIKQALLKTQANARSEEILQKYYQEGITLDSVRALKQEKDNYKKVLKIIKEKEVNMQVFNQCEDVYVYNNVYKKQKDRQLTEEEFITLKEMLE